MAQRYTCSTVIAGTASVDPILMANSDARHTHRRRRTLAPLLACLLPGWLSPTAAANDFEAADIAAGLAPVAPSRIRRVTERVVLTQGTKDWHADAT